MRRYTYRNPFVRMLVWGYDLAGGALLRRRPLARPPQPRHIALLALHQIGDVVMDLPATAAVRKMFPDARLTFITSPAACTMLSARPSGIETVAFAPGWHRVTRETNGAAVSARTEFQRLLRQLRPDAAVFFNPDLHAYRFSRSLGIPVTVGFDHAGGGFHLTHSVPLPAAGHQVERLFALVAALGGAHGKNAGAPAAPVLPVADAARVEWGKKQAAGGLHGPYVAVHPFGSAPTKNWNDAAWSAVIRWCVGRGLGVAVIGGPNDRLQVEEDVRGCVVDFSGNLALDETAAALAGATLFVGVDSGPGHIANAVGTAGVTVFSSVNQPARWRPYRAERWAVVHHEPEDRRRYPLELRQLPAGTNGNPYSDGIAAEEVIAAAERLLP